MSAGYGTRLGPLTLDKPKSLLPVSGVPILERILEKLSDLSGLDEVFVVSNARFYPMFQDWVKTYLAPTPLHVYNDGSTQAENRLGAVRDIQFVAREANLQDDLLVVAGDNIFKFDPSAFVAFARERGGPCIAVKDVGDPKAAVEYGVVRLAEDGQVVEFVEKSKTPPTALVSTCFYYFPKDSMWYLDRYLEAGNNADAPGYYLQWLCKETAVYGWPFTESWFDIGDVQSLQDADAEYSRSEEQSR